MKRWLLKPLPRIKSYDFPADQWYTQGPGLSLVVVAETEGEARKMADKNDARGIHPQGVEHPWLTNEYSSCERVG